MLAPIAGIVAIASMMGATVCATLAAEEDNIDVFLEVLFILSKALHRLLMALCGLAVSRRS
jgi:hypothetical protein